VAPRAREVQTCLRGSILSLDCARGAIFESRTGTGTGRRPGSLWQYGLASGLSSAWRGDSYLCALCAPHLAGADLGPGWYLSGGVLSNLFKELPATLTSPSHEGYSWSRSLTGEGYVDSLRPESAIQLLPPAEREGLLSAVAQAVDGQRRAASASVRNTSVYGDAGGVR
jgi:hypothetical protein